MFVFTYRFMWREEECPDKVNFKIITDIPEHLNSFVEHICALPGITNFIAEYVCQVDVGKISSVVNLLDEKKLEV
ncbi:hypothetical protein [Sigmofec virus UA08Rod_5614]|uniref:Uncharacterized protein n=1 Tax=Sigmofec virus UA08Rod_5614 TaxID=2929431 RepID=A0A976N1Q4_9VIRU|nr:hypothetical protein [Sigmofec virus UA08Rod_5614]